MRASAHYRAAVQQLLRLIGPPAKAHPERIAHFNTFLQTLGAPHSAGRFIHIAGSKGKGSTARMLDAMLRASGRSTLLLTSPALHTMRERVRINGQPADQQQFANAAQKVLEARAHFKRLMPEARLNLFDCLTATALMLHQQHRPDFSVLETGLGGRLDATNVVTPAACVITRIEIEHADVLGGTLQLIAGEKAGIIKPGVPVVMAPQHPRARAVIAEAARRAGAPLLEPPPDAVAALELGPGYQHARFKSGGGHHHFTLPLMGAHQLQNAAAAIAAAQQLGVEANSIARGLEEVDAGGCAQVVAMQPAPLVADSCHTPLSARALVQALGDHLGLRGGAAVVFGTTRGHSTVETLHELKPIGARFVPTQSRHPKSLPAQEVARLMRRAGIAPDQAAPSVAAALEALDGVTLACGSVAVAAEAIQAVRGVESDF